jgi:hypothetical protein
MPNTTQLMQFVEDHINSKIVYLLLFFTAFPYITFLVSPTPASYLQPFFIITALLLLCLNVKKIPLHINKDEYLSFLLPFIGAIYIFISLLLKHRLQYSSTAYISPLIFITLIPTYRLALQILGVKKLTQVFIYTVYTYCIVGLIQVFIDPSFLAYLVGGNKTGILPSSIKDGGIRGVIGLASEPTYYASYILGLATVLSATLNSRRTLIISAVALLQIIFIAKSSTVIAILFCAGVLYTILYRQKISSLLALISLFLLAFLISDYFMPSTLRANLLAHELVSLNFRYLIDVDESSSIRITHAILPFVYALKNYMLPEVFFDLTWVQYLKSFDLPWFKNLQEGSRIINGYGEILIIYGFFVLPLVWSIVKTLLKNQGREFPQAYLGVCIFLLLFTSFSFSTPIVAMCYVLYRTDINAIQSNNISEN